MSEPVVNERIAARRAEIRADRRRRRLRRTVALGALLVVVVGGVLVERSSLVALASVRVEGLDRLDRATVVEVTGIDVGTSVLRLGLDDAREALEELPLVAEARVARDGVLGVVVEVVEAAPFLTARGRGGATVLVGEDGGVLAPGIAPGVPVVQVRGRLPEPGEQVAELPALAAAHAVLRELPGPLAALVDGLRATADDDVVLLLESGVEVRWGDVDRGDEKARALGAVLEDLDGREVSVVDVRAPAAPTVTP